MKSLNSATRGVPAFLLCLIALLLQFGPAADVRASTLIESASSGQCINVYGNGQTPGTRLIQWGCGAVSNEEWILVPYQGHYHIVVSSSGQCMNVYGASQTPGAAIIQWPCTTNAANDQWSIVPVGNYYQLVSASSGLCVNISGNSKTAGAGLIQWPCQADVPAATNDKWSLQAGSVPPIPPVPAAPTTSPTTDIVSASSGQCINVNGGSFAGGAALIQWPCVASSNEEWTLVPYQGHYHIVVSSSGQCMNVYGASQTPGAAIIQWPCTTNATNDQWSIVPVGNYYELVSVSSGQCINVYGNRQTAGTGLIQWGCSQTASDPANDKWSLRLSSPQTLPSAWSGLISLPVTPVGIANLPNGKLMMWSAYEPYAFEGDIGQASGQTYTAVFDPATNASSDILVTYTGDDMFCSGTAVLPDGRVLINGGSSSPKTSLYDPTTGTWSIGAQMHIARGYEADTVLSNGDVLTLGGSWSGGLGGKSGEVWDLSSGWSVKSGIPETPALGADPGGIFRADNHMWLFATSNGYVLQAGPSAQMNWITTGGAGTIQSAGLRGSDAYSINGNAAVYDIGKILKAGGAPAYDQSTGGTIYATNASYLIDITAGAGNPVQVTLLPSMS